MSLVILSFYFTTSYPKVLKEWNLHGKMASNLPLEEGVHDKSVLLVNDEWGTSKGGISTINREIATCILKANAGFAVHALTVYPANKEDEDDARKKDIKLIKPHVVGGLQRIDPSVDWLFLHRSFFPTLAHLNVKVVIGHLPITGAAAIALKEDLFPNQKLVLFNHVIPYDIERYKDGSSPEIIEKNEWELHKAAAEADVVFSVGPRIYRYFENKYRDRKPGVQHVQFLPRPRQEFFDVQIQKPEPDGRMQIFTFGRVLGVECLKGYDMLPSAIGKAMDAMRRVKRYGAPVWVVRGVPRGEWEETEKFLRKAAHGCRILDVVPYHYGTQEDICRDLQQSHLCLIASKTEPFGMIGMEVIAAGLPVLVTAQCSLAEFLYELFPDQYNRVVVDVGIGDVAADKVWADRILEVLVNYDYYFVFAQKLKELLMNCDAFKASYDEFLKICL